MKSIHNPYEVLMQQMSELKRIVIDIRDQPKEDYTTKYYTRKEVARIIRRSIQTIDNYIDRGIIKVENIGERGKLIHHYEIFNKDNSLKELTYKRKA
tara:strand:- start:4534 stop:4824 length:291 start_codon:yes stop_codon:yes gene_type:complete